MAEHTRLGRLTFEPHCCVCTFVRWHRPGPVRLALGGPPLPLPPPPPPRRDISPDLQTPPAGRPGGGNMVWDPQAQVWRLG